MTVEQSWHRIGVHRRTGGLENREADACNRQARSPPHRRLRKLAITLMHSPQQFTAAQAA